LPALSQTHARPKLTREQPVASPPRATLNVGAEYTTL
jgi:hypothetical protein